MSKKADIYDRLSKRERQIMEVVVRMNKANAQEIMENLPDPPSYSSVRALLAIMVKKGYLQHFQEGKRYIYQAVVVKDREKKSMLKKVVHNFFEGSAPKAISTILNFSSAELSKDDYEALKKMIEEAEKQGDD